ncbi:trace amine-associated receptor 1-like [Megalops cyprinoides]|uniref:trace amine-associated receptor 1-like n=1 Tax=Megalops cyprinoides TaxID=118141 RepID=UPI001864B654|nr:trace amine-associated receptor 1-like [Megalops cyprinoides]
MNFSQTGKTEHFCYESMNRSCPKFIIPTAIRAPLYAFFGVAIVFTICGNLLVIIAIAHFKQLHTPTNYLVLSLAMADLLLGAIFMPPSMVRSLESCWYFGDLFCKFHTSAGVMLCTVSILNLSFISIDRYYAVCQPLHYHSKITNGVSVIMVLVSWIVSAFVGFGMVFLNLNILGVEDFYYKNVACIGRCLLFQSVASSSISSVLSFYIPGFIMVGIYQKIFRVAQEQARSINSIACQNVNSEKNKKSLSNLERKATKTLAVVMGVFLSCWTPFFSCNVIHPIVNYSIPPVLFDTLAWIGLLNSTFNPIVYAFFYSWYRKAFRMIIFGKIFHTDSSRSKLCTD